MIRVVGGRHVIKQDTEEELGAHLPTTGRNPIKKFPERYGFEIDELVARVGGSHNFGAAHPKCSNYVGTWSKDPLRWDVDGKGPDFFVDMMKNHWGWFWVSQFEDDTLTYTPSHDPTFPEDKDVSSTSRGEQFISGISSPDAKKSGPQPLKGSSEKLQALRGCALLTEPVNIKVPGWRYTHGYAATI
ncbi:hypothetical protein SARC_03274 [Sphaeroforma arctica JP610]|uniref:Plant heme peroxidase family profile domain-containing protein n=1 Tax=Sphaeroforma arctica JP610 TaxID=667725 RepID=A0A0L0G642_9EUKA|nr:hypothetical protein SARC_03274 [Sphaeroforma arctica JP610]KNC84500.1 hypothetical protein SARC_03274 [Sphaeroforma arctica JP610]|eukprot:XP_014158402.1 hypothetical protein SARC_03274 [Sphaeroforma arctica JP610]